MFKKVRVLALLSFLILTSYSLFAAGTENDSSAESTSTTDEVVEAKTEAEKKEETPEKKEEVKNKKIETRHVDNLNSWQENIDISKKTNKRMKYNIMIKAVDQGGNTAVEGPFNIFLDPNSDIPISNITSPYHDMRVAGNLNIVGTAIDDDGIDHVMLTLDEGKIDSEGNSIEKTVRAEGKEFWSYYLDTTDLEEGPHTIKVFAYDINPGDAKQISKPYVIQWQLDRQLPVTDVQDKEMGLLVSGNVHFYGEVSDGNGIDTLEYSVDGGNLFEPIKLKNVGKDKSKKAFDITINTKDFEDGASVLWFRAKDLAGSVGLYSFLYFIDNTKPKVEILSPEKGEVQHGKFTVAGFAKDDIGIKEKKYDENDEKEQYGIKWTFGEQSGEIPFIPGNPYWAVDLDTTGLKDKAQKFIITATDKANNTVVVTQNIPLDQELDRPVVKIQEPQEGQVFTDTDYLYARGLITDDDKVVKVSVQLDNEEPIEQPAEGEIFNGTYTIPLKEPGKLEAGNHTITVIGTDENGVQGHPVVTNIVSKVILPKIDTPTLGSGKGAETFVDGMEIHPESGKILNIPITSPYGLTNVYYSISWGKEGLKEEAIELDGKKTDYLFSIPVLPDSAKGMMNLTVTGTDTLGRTTTFKGVYYVTNTSKIKKNENSIVFTDSRIGEDGRIICDDRYPVSGYALGERASTVKLIPETPFANATLSGNQIKIVTTDKEGISSPVVVEVTYESGRKARSDKSFTFVNETKKPEITFNNVSDDKVFDLTNEDTPIHEVVVSGDASSVCGINDIGYRIHTIKTELKDGVFSSSPSVEEAKLVWSSDFVSDESGFVNFSKTNNRFTLNVASDYFDKPGIYVIEIIAKSEGGMLSSKTVAVDNLRPLPILQQTPEMKKPPKQPVAKAPSIVWLEGVDVYAVGVYQGDLATVLTQFDRSEMNEGANTLKHSISTTDGVTTANGEYTAKKDATLNAFFDNVDSVGYLSGMPVIIPYGAVKEGPNLQVAIDSSVPVTSVSYKISGDSVPGGDVTTTGTVKLGKPDSDTPNRWIADIPLLNQPSRICNIEVTVKAGSLTKVIKGSLSVVRPEDFSLTNDKKDIAGYLGTNTVYDNNVKAFVLSNGSKYLYYANYATPLKTVVVNRNGLTATVVGNNLIELTSEKEGYYNDVVLTVTDNYGDRYETSPINIVVDSSTPEVTIAEPVLNAWVGDYITVKGTANDPIGVKSIEYSLDKGQTWKEILINSGDVAVTYSKELNIKTYEDGLITIDVRVTDMVGKTAITRSSNYKDVTPPTVDVIEPTENDDINGKNLIVFDAKDNVALDKVQYHNPENDKMYPVEINPLVHTYIGLDDYPILNDMAFEFTDMAGNKARVSNWSFIINNEKDKPTTEIHVPEENQVITRDFEISGVVLDDDGESSVYYKIDNGEYTQVSTKEVYKEFNPEAQYELKSNYSIHVPFETMTDNEHTVYIYAVDQNGVKGPETKRTFRISTEEPKGAVIAPTIDQAVKGSVTISGNASDKNGIAKVQVSLDNGCSYNDAIGTEKWSYTVDTRVIPGGTQVVFLKVFDNYGITGLYSSLINIDNDAPELKLELPLDDSTTSGTLFFSGYTLDNVKVKDLKVKIRNLNGSTRPLEHELKIDNIIGESLDITNLPDGFYNVEVSAVDDADNVTNVSRNVHLKKDVAPAVVDVLYPLYGEHKAGEFTIYGQAQGETPIKELHLYLDGGKLAVTELTGSGFYKFDMNPDNITAGTHTYHVDAVLVDGTKVSSREQQITYSPFGPWVTIDNFTYGDFAIERPKITGRAGYTVSEEDKALLKDKKTPYQIKDEISKRKISKIEISFNNGKSFEEISEKGKWEYRIENQDLPAGLHFLLIKATMENGEVAINRTIVQIDNEKPSIKLRSPSVGGAYNQELNVSGLSSDDVKLKDVEIVLRKGDKNSYGVPSFIQGLYLDAKFLGASLYQVGVGLTFFDDVVKIQGSFGQLTREQYKLVNKTDKDFRIGGNIGSLKILANVADIPFNFFFGHDFDWLSATVAVGADFSYYSQSGRDGKGKIVSALVGQLEFPKVTFKKAKAFSSFALYLEGSIWLFPSDIETTAAQQVKAILPTGSIGIRTNIF